MKLSRLQAFTLTEILMVAIIIAVLAGFIMPNYGRFRQQADEKVGFNNLSLIRAGLNLYRTQNNNYPAAAANVTVINTNLGTTLIPGNLTYSCGAAGSGGSPPPDCFATSTSYSWILKLDMVQQKVVCSTGPACPRCTTSSCPY